MSTEIWKPVTGYEGLYEVSDHGRVRSLDRRDRMGRFYKGRVLRPRRLKHGYLRVNLCFNGSSEARYVHRLVLEAFVGPCPEGMQACHFPDRDPANNRRSNLRWDAVKANGEDRVRHGTAHRPRGERCGRAKLTEEIALSMFRMREEGRTLREIAQACGTGIRNVQRILSGERWPHLAESRKTAA